jgi:polyhydroxyalkanoate synthesis regulator phasin
MKRIVISVALLAFGVAWCSAQTTVKVEDRGGKVVLTVNGKEIDVTQDVGGKPVLIDVGGKMMTAKIVRSGQGFAVTLNGSDAPATPKPMLQGAPQIPQRSPADQAKIAEIERKIDELMRELMKLRGASMAESGHPGHAFTFASPTDAKVNVTIDGKPQVITTEGFKFVTTPDGKPQVLRSADGKVIVQVEGKPLKPADQAKIETKIKLAEPGKILQGFKEDGAPFMKFDEKGIPRVDEKKLQEWIEKVRSEAMLHEKIGKDLENRVWVKPGQKMEREEVRKRFFDEPFFRTPEPGIDKKVEEKIFRFDTKDFAKAEKAGTLRKDSSLAALEARVKALEAEVKRLKEENKALRGKGK